MNRNTKKQIGRDARSFFVTGTVCRVVERGNPIEDEMVGEAVVLSTTRDQIFAEVRGRRFGFDGKKVSFRLPTLTQRGGNLRICLP